MKKVLAAVAAAKASTDPAVLSTVDVLLSAAIKTIDKAASKGILKKNTAARRKSLVCRACNTLPSTSAPAAPTVAAPAVAA